MSQRCSCPWCGNLAVEGKESILGAPTCETHSWDNIGKLTKRIADAGDRLDMLDTDPYQMGHHDNSERYDNAAHHDLHDSLDAMDDSREHQLNEAQDTLNKLDNMVRLEDLLRGKEGK